MSRKLPWDHRAWNPDNVYVEWGPERHQESLEEASVERVAPACHHTNGAFLSDKDGPEDAFYEEEISAIDRRTLICLNACQGISTHALEYGVVQQLIETCSHTLFFLKNLRFVEERELELCISRLQLAIAKATDKEPNE